MDQSLSAWIGREERREEPVSDRMLQQFRATFGATVANGEPVPLGLHWCLMPPAASTTELQDDGHAPTGALLPTTTLPRRMWAGGEVAFLQPLCAGETVRRLSTVRSVETKAGRSGSLCFVAVDHVLHSGPCEAIRERQDIVYRPAWSSSTQPGVHLAEPAPASDQSPKKVDMSETLAVDARLLFRYSALTFNTHRIHYDADYAREAEGYAGLVVQGPLQATMLVNFAARHAGRTPATFRYRSMAPIFAPATIRLCGAWEDGDVLRCWTEDEAGHRAMLACANFRNAQA